MTKTNPTPATCDKCKSEDVTWFKSKRTGKFYLCEVFTDAEGDRIASSRDFHSKYCGVVGAHEAEQAKLTSNDGLNTTSDEFQTDYAEQLALDISNLNTITERVLAVADLARSNSKIAEKVCYLWHRQGENLLAEMLEGVLNAHADD